MEDNSFFYSKRMFTSRLKDDPRKPTSEEVKLALNEAWEKCKGNGKKGALVLCPPEVDPVQFRRTLINFTCCYVSPEPNEANEFTILPGKSNPRDEKIAIFSMVVVLFAWTFFLRYNRPSGDVVLLDDLIQSLYDYQTTSYFFLAVAILPFVVHMCQDLVVDYQE